MLRLIKCELWKLKRKKFVFFVVFAALLFPIPFTILVLGGGVGGMDAFESLYAMLLCLGEPIMLPCVLGIVAAMLFFMERDNGTLKNSRTVPVPAWKIASAKIAVLYILGLVYACATMISSMLGGFIAGSDLGNIGDKVWVSVITALFYTTSVLPVVIAIVGFNRSYIFSIIFTFFYTMFGFILGFTGQFTSSAPVMKLLTNIMPAPIIYRWQASQMIEPGTNAYSVWEPYLLPMWIVALTVFIIGALSYGVIIKIYQKQES
ncbi:ABC transporter permease [Desulfitobacterium hafniense]|uniref:ABC transporter permease n=1 Tax=Desulfitobacterium hafniense TaxID=49338 RepID=UPI000373EAB9|nr:ABC transporter permease [Desulfitobacterium hafniense]